MAVAVELDDAVGRRFGDVVGEHVTAVRVDALPQARAQPRPVEDVVAQDEGDALVADEVGADEERLREAFRARLRGVGHRDAEVRPIPQQPLELRLVLRRRDDQDLPDAGHHERRQRVVDHRLVIDGHELLADALGDRVQPGARAASENDSTHGGTAYLPRQTAIRRGLDSVADLAHPFNEQDDHGDSHNAYTTHPMKWLIVGAGGMLGLDLQVSLTGRDLVALARGDLDVTSADEVQLALDEIRPDVVVNAAAYTAVDAAEEHEARAFNVNAVGPANLASACARTGARLVQVSTDYVFDGQAKEPYAEEAPVAPRSAYGRTKAAGEWAVRAHLPERSWIVRTAWLYGAGGPNFVRTMINLEAQRDTLEVVDDQRGQPTWTADLARQIVRLVEADAAPGIYHGTSSGETTWFGLTRAIFERLGADPERVRPTTTDKFPRPAPRPAYSVLGHEAWARGGYRASAGLAGVVGSGLRVGPQLVIEPDAVLVLWEEPLRLRLGQRGGCLVLG